MFGSSTPVTARTLAGLAARTPLLAGAAQIAYVDIDDTVKRTYGYAQQGAGYGYSGVKGLNALLATVSTPLAPPVIAGCRLRKGAINSARGAARLLADALVTARATGASGLVVVRRSRPPTNSCCSEAPRSGRDPPAPTTHQRTAPRA